MPGIIDVLAYNRSDCAKFVVDLNEDYVSLTYPTLPEHDQGKVYNAAGLSDFVAGDKLEILSAGYVLPLGFSSYISAGVFEWVLPNFEFTFQSTPSHFDAISKNLNRFYILSSDFEFSIGAFVDDIITANFIENYYIKLFINNLFISMEGVSSELNGAEFLVPFFVKVRHTLPMVETAIPVLVPNFYADPTSYELRDIPSPDGD